MIQLAVGSVVLLYVLYVLIMHYKQKREEEGGLEWYETVFVYALLLVGYPLDVAVNLTVGTVLFLDLPKERTLSSRLERYVDGDYGWRQKLAWKIAPLLNRHDPDHIA